MHVLFLSDLHGLVFDALRMAAHLRAAMGVDITAAFVCGDLGYFPSLEGLDGPTAKFAREDPDELGYLARFVQTNQEVARWLAALAAPPVPLYFIRGNHEDHEALGDMWSSSAPVAVDVYGLVHYLPDATPLVLRDASGTELIVAALGGIEGANPRKRHPLCEVQDDAAVRLLGMPRGAIDVLITHDPPAGLSPRPTGPGGESRRSAAGSEVVRLVVEWLQPQYLFYGHLHRQLEPEQLGPTRCVGVNTLRGTRESRAPEPGSVVVLEWNGKASHCLVPVDDDSLRDWRWAPPVAGADVG
jgi:Icc-related predicted phosphoesterase